MQVSGQAALDKLETFLVSEKPVDPRDHPIYGVHAYWAKKPPNIVARCIELFSSSGEIVLDPFAGVGVVAVEALRLKRRVVASDLSALSVFIMNRTLEPYFNNDIEQAKVAFGEVKNRVWGKNRQFGTIKELFRTRCPECKRDDAFVLETRSDCTNREEDLRMREWELKAVKYYCENCRKTYWKIAPGKQIKGPPKKTPKARIAILKNTSVEIDAERIADLNAKKPKHWLPTWELIYNTRKGVYKGMTIADIYTKRNLHVLSEILHQVQSIPDEKSRQLLRFAFGASLHLARMTDYKRASPQNYYVPKEDMTDLNAWQAFEGKLNEVIRCKQEILKIWSNLGYREGEPWQANDFSQVKNGSKYLLIKQRDAKDLAQILGSESVDYVHTDPPYADQVQYLELSIPWISWLGLESETDFRRNLSREIMLTDSPDRPEKRNENNYRNEMNQSMEVISRVLKRDRWATIWYCCSEKGHWDAMVKYLFNIGLVFQGRSMPIRRVEQTFAVNVAKGVLEGRSIEELKKLLLKSKVRDIETIFNCYKPSAEVLEKMKPSLQIISAQPEPPDVAFIKFASEQLKRKALRASDLYYSFISNYSSTYYSSPPTDPNYYNVLLMDRPKQFEYNVDEVTGEIVWKLRNNRYGDSLDTYFEKKERE